MIGFYRSTLGKKFVVAITGALLYGFVVMHMLGNLKAFLGTDAESGLPKLDVYARFLREMGEHIAGHAGVLWTLRIALIVALVLHVATIIQLRLIIKRARPVGYAKVQYGAASVAARTMFWGGVLLFAFIIYHIAHMTLGLVPIAGFAEGHVYANVYSAFSSVTVTGIYVLAMVLLAFHLQHGVWSMFQTLGLDSPQWNVLLRRIAFISAVLVFLGFVSVPLSVVAGLLPEPPVVRLNAY